MRRLAVGAAALTATVLTGCSSYWVENTLRRTDWIKETCSKAKAMVITGKEAKNRLNIPQGNQTWDELRALCEAYGLDVSQFR